MDEIVYFLLNTKKIIIKVSKKGTKKFVKCVCSSGFKISIAEILFLYKNTQDSYYQAQTLDSKEPLLRSYFNKNYKKLQEITLKETFFLEKKPELRIIF